jgi:ketosteroid isomerase-like protein
MSEASVEEFDKFVDECRGAVSQQVAGHTEPFQDLWSRAEDVVLMGAAGSHAVGWQDVSASLSWASSHLNFGNWSAENLLTLVEGHLGLTVDLEHMSRLVDGKVEERTLRASQGYRFEDGRWHVLFRHGDPMAERVELPGAQAR